MSGAATCDRKDCGGPRLFRPVLEWYPARPGYTGPPAKMDIGLQVCEAHAEKDAEATQQLLSHFSAAARSACHRLRLIGPDPDRMRIVWERVQ